MKKVFFSLFVFCSFLIFYHISKIDFNIYNLLNVKHTKEFKALQNSFSSEIIFLSDSKDLSKQLEAINRKYPTFSSLQSGINFNNELKESLEKLQIATFAKYEQFQLNPNEFFLQSIAMLFDQFSPRILPISKDFFSLSTQSTLFNQATKLQIDLASNLFYIQNQDKRFYVVLGTLQTNYRVSNLLAFHREVKNHHIALMSGSSLFSAYGQEVGNKEGMLISLITLAIISTFLLFAFKNIKIFYLLFVVIFSLTFGLGISFLLLERVHILSLIMSISLIGIVIDFALHFICHQEGRRIARYSILSMKRIFIFGFIISASGYLFFLFSSFVFLHQIAIISILSLLGALLFAYFCLPLLLQGTTFHSSKGFEYFLGYLWNFVLFLRKKRHFLYAVMVLIMAFGGHKIYNSQTRENIKNYASIPQSLFDEASTVGKLTDFVPPTQVLVLTHCSFKCERELIRQIKDNNIAQDLRGLSQIFLDQEEQKEVIKAFQKYSQDPHIIRLYTQAGINTTQEYFNKISRIKPQGIEELLKNSLVKNHQYLYLNQNQRLVVINSSTSLLNHQNFQKILSNISSKYQANISFFYLPEEINQGFETIKQNAIFLKLIGLSSAFILLLFVYGIKQALKIIFVMTSAILTTLCLLEIFGLEINIFAIFGLILASTIGLDYIIFAKSQSVAVHLRLKSIVCACITSFTSFFFLFFSSTYAVAIFGLSVALGVLLIALMANLEFNN